MEAIKARLKAGMMAVALGLAVLAPWSLATAQQSDGDWNQVVAAAKQEGKVIVWGEAGDSRTAFWKDAFEKAYPGIKVELFQAPLNSQRDNRYAEEYKAGIFKADVFVTGGASALTRFMPANMVQPIKPLLRPDILDPAHWTTKGGPAWIDKQHQYVLVGDALTYPTATVNAKVTDLNSYEDLLSPKYDGKIVMADPFKSGSGFAFVLFLLQEHGLGPDYIRKFFKNKRIVFNDDDRTLVDWVSSGRALVGLNLRPQDVTSLQEIGGKLKIVGPLTVSGQKVGFTIGSDGVIWLPAIRPLPHPNATRVYVNWFYSVAGQQAMVNSLDIGTNVAGVDLSKVSKWSQPLQGVNYMNLMQEDLLKPDVAASLRKFIAQVMTGN